MTGRLGCPLCGAATGTRAELRRHLLVGHRKRNLVEALVESTVAPTEPA